MSAPILHIAPFLWSGAGRVIAALAADQARRTPVIVVTTGRLGALADWPAYRRTLRRAGVRHVTIDTFQRAPDVLWTSASRLAALVTDVQPRVIHAHAGTPTGVAAIARDIAGQPIRLVAQMYSWGPDRPGWMDTQDLWAFRQADRVVSSAHAYSRLLREGGVPARRLTYLPWGLDLDALPRRHDREVAADPPVLGVVGRIEPRKQQVALVEAFAALRRRVPDAQLELVGPVADHAYAAELTRTIARLGVRASVRVTGLVPEVARVVRRWSLFVSLSSDEGQGLAVLEAMALGVPVAARVVAGIEDFLADGRTGYALPHRGARATAARLAEVLSTSNASVVARARALVERDYNWTTMVRRVDRLYGQAG